jgi:hypothetical protein
MRTGCILHIAMLRNPVTGQEEHSLDDEHVSETLIANSDHIGSNKL